MFQFIIEKLLHKKWMNLCLLTGFFLLISIAACNPMYQEAALEKLLQHELLLKQASSSTYQGIVSADYHRANVKESKLDSNVFPDADQFDKRLKEILPEEAVYEVHTESLSYTNAASDIKPNGEVVSRKIKCRNMSGLENQVHMIAGEMYTDASPKDGAIDVIVSKGAMYKNGYLLGERFTFDTLTFADGRKLTIRITGVFEEKESGSLYWVRPLSEYSGDVFMSDKAFQSLLQDSNIQKNMLYETFFRVLNTEKLQVKDVPSLEHTIALLKNEDGDNSDVTCSIQLAPVIEKFQSNEGKVKTTMTILQVPVFVLLFAFIYMVSKQMLEMEKGEIAMLKSRGASRRQILLTYIGQSGVLAAIAVILGVPAGWLLCKLLGSSNAFLQFSSESKVYVSIGWKAYVYALGGAVIAMSSMTLPVLRHAKVGIVEQKSRMNSNPQPLWRTYFLDMLLFAFACYEYYTFSHQKEHLMKQMLENKGLDPMLYLSASLFILGGGFVMLRLLPLLIKGIYRIGKKHWNSAMYSSFLQIIRTSNRQIFISVFLILTVATGIFCANIARSINQNLEERTRYDNGADFVLQESWNSNKAAVLRAKSEGVKMDLVYEEPDFQKYDLLKKASNATKVIRDNKVTFFQNKKEYTGEMIGIHTKDFGETAWMKDGILDKHWYYYLNKLAENPNGVLVSSNVEKKLHAKIGDTLLISRKNELEEDIGTMEVVICGFVKAFPSYVKGNDKYFFITNLNQVVNSYGMTPYEIWVKDAAKDSNYMNQFIHENDIKLTAFHDTEKEIVQQKKEPVCQVTNGLLTLNFIVILILCMIGFLIYWILSIRQRELLFGIYRAMGMSMKEVGQMLLNEHIFSSLTSILTGVVIGEIVTKLFVPLILLTFLPEDHNLTIEIITRASDMVKLGVSIGIMLVVCFMVIVSILKKMKISQVLKLGEE